MKTLIFALIFTSIAHAAGPAAQPELISDSEIGNKVISAARDIENERILEGIPDFQNCKQRFQFQKEETTADLRQRSAQSATKCFQDALVGKNSSAEISQIADKLNLQTYKLIPSKSVQEITKYLSNKMYKSLTGIDYEETDAKKRIESLKFNKNKKIVDQKQFIILYKNQVAKNILTEVTRFCLEDFRLVGGTTPAAGAPPVSFNDHWQSYLDGTSPFQSATTSPGVTDTGIPKFEGGAPSQSRDDKDTAYRNIIRATFPGKIPASDKLSEYFFYCGQQINALCTAFEGRTAGTTTPTDLSGSKACLAKSRLVSFKKALSGADLIIADFNANGGRTAYQLLDDPSAIIKAYGSGQDRSEKSLNEITNNASIDFFTATENEDTQKADNCIKGGAAACDDFIIVDDSREKIQYNVEIEYSAKREAELARVKALKREGGLPLVTYLKENGYLAAAEAIEKNTQPAPNLEALVAQAWDAKKIALQEEIHVRLGKRQITEKESEQTSGTTTVKEANAKQNATETLNERARLARVIFFNNIISSNLNLVDGSNNNRRLGQNTQALRGELTGLEGQVNASVFQNLQESLPAGQAGTEQNPVATGREDISNVSFLDQFLGGPAPATTPAGGAQTGPRPAGQRNP